MKYKMKCFAFIGEKAEDRDITVKVAPSRDVTSFPMGGDLSSLWDTSQANAVIHNGALIQLQQGKIIAVRK